jgi:DNA-binding transcriptional ArsR family regulator
MNIMPTVDREARQQVDKTTPVKPPCMKAESAAALMQMDFPALKWIVKRHLPEGCSLLLGKPKIGKSWLALDIALAVAEGGECLGKDVREGDVLLLALEDSPRRLQRRLRAMLGQREVPKRLQYGTEAPRLDQDLIEQLRGWIKKVKRPRLIVIDVLQRIRPASGRKDNPYESDYNTIRALQELAGETRVAILIVHHQRKASADDLYDTASGTLGLTGAADSVLVLVKEPQGKALYGTGRDMEEFGVAVAQNAYKRWDVLGDATEVRQTDERSSIIAALRKNGQMRSQEIADLTNKSPSNVGNLLKRLLDDGVVEKVKFGCYRLRESTLLDGA